jgi:hypothetical protein
MRRSSSADVFFEQWSVNRARTVSLLRLAQFDTELHSTTIAFWGDLRAIQMRFSGSRENFIDLALLFLGAKAVNIIDVLILIASDHRENSFKLAVKTLCELRDLSIKPPLLYGSFTCSQIQAKLESLAKQELYTEMNVELAKFLLHSSGLTEEHIRLIERKVPAVSQSDHALLAVSRHHGAAQRGVPPQEDIGLSSRGGQDLDEDLFYPKGFGY